ncbi:MAG TPA: ABC transporter permease subunit [Acidiferrobacteraceae bacterium]|nr:ABC transporter permease subunit [Acidiferrobacteraceae bacterium]
MILTIARRELRTLFLSPLAWIILGILQLILGFLFVGHLDLYLRLEPRLLTLPHAPGMTEVVGAPTLGNASVLMLLVVPMLSMRLISEERRSRTLALLFSAPLSMTEIVLGKYLGLLGFLLITAVLTVLMPLSLLLGGSLDGGMFAAGVLGLVLVLATFAAVGLLVSALSPNPTLAAIGTFGALFLLWIAAWSASGTGAVDAILRYVSLVNHFEPFLHGVVGSVHVAYFLLLSALCLMLTIRRLDADRLGG